MKRLLITIIFVFISAVSLSASERVITLDFETNEVTSLSALPELSVPVIADIIGDNLSTSLVPIKNYIYGGLTDSNNVGVIAKSNRLYKDPAIVMDPTVGHGKVFWPGESVNRVVGINQWYAFSGIVFNFDKDLTTLAVNFSYLNDRKIACGKVNIIIQKVDATGSVIWENVWRVTSHQQGNYIWRNYVLAKSRFTSRIAGRSFNRVMIVEADLQWDSFKGLIGSGYLDDITIKGDTLVPDVEAVIEEPIMQDKVVEEEITVVEPEITEPTVITNKTFIVDSQRTLSVTCLDKDAAYNHELYAEINGSSIFVFNSNKKGKTVNLGRFPIGTVVNFKLKVTTTGYIYYTGKKSNNPDGVTHSMITGFGNSWVFGFEDQYGGGDVDYNDCLFEVNGVNLVEGTTEI